MEQTLYTLHTQNLSLITKNHYYLISRKLPTSPSPLSSSQAHDHSECLTSVAAELLLPPSSPLFSSQI